LAFVVESIGMPKATPPAPWLSSAQFSSTRRLQFGALEVVVVWLIRRRSFFRQWQLRVKVCKRLLLFTIRLGSLYSPLACSSCRRRSTLKMGRKRWKFFPAQQAININT